MSMKLFGPMKLTGDGGNWLVGLTLWKTPLTRLKFFARTRIPTGPSKPGEIFEQLYIFPFILVWRRQINPDKLFHPSPEIGEMYRRGA